MDADKTSQANGTVGGHDGGPQLRRGWWALGLAAIVVASALAGRAAVPASLTVALVGGLLLVTAWSAPFGLAALLASAMLSPWSLPTGTRTAISLVLPLLAALTGGWVVRCVRRRDRALLRAGPVQALIAFAAVATTSFAVAAFVSSGCGFQAPMHAQVGALAGLLLPAGAFLVAADELDRRWVERLTWLFLLLGGSHVLCHFVPGLWWVGGFLFQYGADGSLFWVWLVALASGEALANRRLHAEWRMGLAWLVAIVFYLALAFSSDWLAGWMPPLVGAAVAIAVAAPRVAAVGGAVGALGVLAMLGRIAPKIASPDNLYSLSTRLDAWVSMRRIIAINPVLGLGPANYYHCTPLYPIRGYTVHFSSHNNYIDIVAQTGVLGLLCLLWFAAACAAVGLRVWRRAAAERARGVVCGCLGGLAATLAAGMLGDWWLPFVYNETLNGLRSSVSAWIFLGALVALARDAQIETSWILRRSGTRRRAGIDPGFSVERRAWRQRFSRGSHNEPGPPLSTLDAPRETRLGVCSRSRATPGWKDTVMRAGRSVWLIVACVAGIAHAAAGADRVEWSAPTLVFETAADIHAPAVAVDPTDRVHVAWAIHAGHDPEEGYIYAAHGDGTSWSPPQRLISSHTAEAPSLAIDLFAELHLIWYGTLGRLQYSRNSSTMAGWRYRVTLAESNPHAQISADPHGRLHLIYAASIGPMYRASDDGGGTWTAPVRVAGPSARNAAADSACLALSAAGVLHVVWTEFEFPRFMPPLGVFYARSTDGGTTWSPAVPLAGPGCAQINVAAAADDTVHVAWNGMVETEGRYHRWSSDGGATWSPTQQIVARGGIDVPPQLVIDSTRVLHLITAYDAAVWHAVWDGERWSEPDCVACGAADPLATAGEPSAVVADGNTLHVVYWQEHRHQLWHTVARLAAPRVAPTPVQTVGWWSDRFWHRDAQRVPALLGILASIGLVRILRLVRRGRGGNRSRRSASALG